MPDQPAEDLWTTVYKGKVVRFCCNNCVESFRREPEKYVGLVPQLQNAQQKPAVSASDSNKNDHAKLTWILRASFFFVAFLLSYLAIRFNNKQVSEEAVGMSFVVQAIMAFAFALIVTQLFKSHQANQHLQLELVKARAKSEIHLATYYDYGVPPVPDNPAVQPELSQSFYRGNDERSPVLFNGGNYQTAQFDIQIQHSDGSPVRVGDALTDEALYLSFSIRKPENAPKRMYDHTMMSRMFLTCSYEPTMGWDKPIADKTPLEVVTADEFWRCRFPLNISRSNNMTRFDPKTVTREKLATVKGVGPEVATWFVNYRNAGYPIVGPEDLRQAGITGQPARIISASLDESSNDGLVYVCEAFFHKDRQLGARFHYGIKYDVKIQDGRVVEGSEIWMGALSRSLKAKKGAIPDDQWLSTKPLPSLPSAQDISDELLGIDDYDF